MELRVPSRVLAVLGGLLTAALSLAQDGAKASQFGTTDLTFVRVSGLEFTTWSGGAYGNRDTDRYPKEGEPLVAAVHVPTGSIIDYLEIIFCDSVDPQDILLYLYSCDHLGTSCPEPVANVNSFAAPGCSAISTSGFQYQVNGVGNLFLYAVFQVPNNLNLALMGAVVGYRLQVSPAPAVATFNDAPTSDPGFQFIEALFAAGITSGCGGGNFCPDAQLTRRQMAVFLAKALGLHWQ